MFVLNLVIDVEGEPGECVISSGLTGFAECYRRYSRIFKGSKFPFNYRINTLWGLVKDKDDETVIKFRHLSFNSTKGTIDRLIEELCLISQ